MSSLRMNPKDKAFVLSEPITLVKTTTLRDIPAAAAERIRRRVVDGDIGPRLDVAAFNSAP